MKMDNLQDLLIEDLKDLYDAEHQITKALPKMAKAASSQELKSAFEEHLTQTENQIKRLEQVFASMGKKATRKTCQAMKGLVEEGSELMQEDADPEVLDAALIGAAQKVEHYEIASYGTVATYAQMLGHNQAVQLLRATLQEEKQTDDKLTMLAERKINQRAQ
jgi:ferritin-like metal-binding protein YciE